MEASRTDGLSRKRKDRDAPGPPEPPAGGNRLLAGYLAHEFLSSGTVLGERHGVVAGTEARGRAAAAGYDAVAVLVQHGGARVPGVVNPAQLAAWTGW
ncbi:hypothetical protein PR202_ga00489 [Eleusine coracana subsp. coracana]|uniref:Uncharacterized protein n=1 Tax=Eleusine coracana subsp. coracana TaxID=191504 RepID=A0AAV5BGD9_ELECO|nr:hypothetical protein PR202_ga00489 [Eleusine coracana subsp. coracana]